MLLFVLISSSACGERQTAVDDAAAAREGGAAASAKTREIVDMGGRVVTLPAEIERIGTLGSVPMINTFVESLGAGAKIYNQPSAFHDIHGRWKMHKEFAPQLVNGPYFQSANHELLTENIIAAKPDVCVTMTRSIADTLGNLGIACVYVSWKNIDSMKESVMLLGEVLNARESAARYVAYLDEKLSWLKTLSAAIPASQRITVLYSNPAQFRIPGILTEEWVDAAGGLSVTRDASAAGRQQYALEDLLQWDPEVIFSTNARLAEEMKADEKLRHLSAIKHDAVVAVPTVGHMWGGHTVEAPIAGMWIMHKLYPERMPREKLVDEIKYFYRTFFLYEMSDEQINNIIAGSAP